MKKNILLSILTASILVGCNNDDDSVKVTKPTDPSETWTYVNYNAKAYLPSQFTVREIYIKKENDKIYSTPFPDLTDFSPLIFNYLNHNLPDTTLPIITPFGVYQTVYDKDKKEYFYGDIINKTSNSWTFKLPSNSGTNTLELTFTYKKLDLSHKTLTDTFQVFRPTTSIALDDRRFPEGSACIVHESTIANETLLSVFRVNPLIENYFSSSVSYPFGNNTSTDFNLNQNNLTNNQYSVRIKTIIDSNTIYGTGYAVPSRNNTIYNRYEPIITTEEDKIALENYCTLFNKTATDYLNSLKPKDVGPT